MHSTRSASDKVYPLLAHDRWFSPDTPASSTTKTGGHDIAEILLKVALKHKLKNKISHIHKVVVLNISECTDILPIEDLFNGFITG